MFQRKNYITKSEEELMDLFWSTDVPMTSVDVLNNQKAHTWTDSYLHIMLRSLMKKGLIHVEGMVQYHSQYARAFVPSMTREEYYAKYVLSKGMPKEALAKVMAAMVHEVDEPNELIDELQSIIRSLKGRDDKNTLSDQKKQSDAHKG